MREQEPLDELYFKWLCGLVENAKSQSETQTHWQLFEQLHRTPFKYFVANDHNRAWDGKDLREEFATVKDFEPDHNWMELECSFLEMLIGLSRRASYQTRWKPSKWFWHMLENLEIKKYTDARYHDGIRIAVDVVLKTVNDRTYDATGHGGIFPLKDSSNDQRDVEIWYQLAEYLFENRMTP